MSWPEIPPEYANRRWASKDGTMSRFPPVTIGNPAEPVDAFFDFRAYHGLIGHREHPDDRCDEHHRYLSKPELDAGGCFWCHPELNPNYKPEQERLAS